MKPLIVRTERVAYLGINTTQPPFNDLNLRKAVAYAIDKEGITEGILSGGEKVVGELVAPASFGWVDGIEPYPYDPEKAKALVAEAGDAAKQEIAFATAPVFDQRIVQALQQMLNDAGFNVSISMTDMATYLKGAQGPLDQRPTLSFGRWSCACQDADGIMYPLLQSESNWSRYQNPGPGRAARRGTLVARRKGAPRGLREGAPHRQGRRGDPAALPGLDHLWRAAGLAVDAHRQ